MYLSLKETGPSFKFAFVSIDNPLQNIWGNIKKSRKVSLVIQQLVRQLVYKFSYTRYQVPFNCNEWNMR